MFKRVWYTTIVVLVVVVMYMVYDIVTDIIGSADDSAVVVSNDEVSIDTKGEETTTPKPIEETTTQKEAKKTVTLVAVGDMLGHESVIFKGNNNALLDSYDTLFQEMKTEFSTADIAVINQETMLAGSEFPYGGYPNFNSPQAIGTAEANAGFDVVLMATNHSRDVWEKGIENALEFWKTTHPEMMVLGINESVKAQNAIPIMEKNGIKIAMLNYTYGLNGYTLADGKEYLVNLMDEEKIKSDILQAKELADFVIVYPHWGVEYVYTPTDEQVHFAQMMSDAGADLIIGTHPHVLQSIEWLDGANGNRTLCYYSLGNYISGQNRLDTMLGGMASLTISKEDGKTSVESASLVPIVTHYEWGGGVYLSRTYRLSKYTDQLVNRHSIRNNVSGFSIEKLKELSEQIVGKTWLED